MKKNYTHIIWDFNGTIYNDVDACIKSANRLLSAYDLPLITSLQQYRSLFGFPIQDYYARMGFDFENTTKSMYCYYNSFNGRSRCFM